MGPFLRPATPIIDGLDQGLPQGSPGKILQAFPQGPRPGSGKSDGLGQGLSQSFPQGLPSKLPQGGNLL